MNRKLKTLIQKEFDSKNTKSKKIKIPLASPPFDTEEIIEAIDSLLNKKTTMGSKVKKFEKKFAEYIGVKNACMVNSGSSANLLALTTLTNPEFGKRKIEKGDEVITPAVTWATTVYPIVNIGAKPVFVDVDDKTYNIKPEEIEKAITRKTKSIMIVHLLGNPCKIREIQKIAKKHNLFLIEDCCEAHGARVGTRKVGTFGDIGTFSFFASHHITTMEGGMVVTNNPTISNLAKSSRAFGWIREMDSQKLISKKFSEIDSRFLFVKLGFNIRPTELQGAFGIHQIKKLEKFIKIRETNARYWKSKLSKFSKYIQLPVDLKNYRNVFFVYPITVKNNKYFTKNELVKELEKKGIETRPVMAGNMVMQPVIKLFDYKISGKLKNSENIMKNSFVIGNHQEICQSERKYVANTITNFIEKKIS